MNKIVRPIVALMGLVVVAWAAMHTQERVPDAADSPRLVPIMQMSVARAAHQATTLQSGEILITGGCSGRCDIHLRTAELYDPIGQIFRPAAAMENVRDSHIAVTLPDGRVLVAGGWSARRATRSTEIYDPRADRFVAAGNMVTARAAAAAARLSDGRVLVVGGQTSELEPLASAEIFDPDSFQFLPAASMMVPRVGHVAVTLADGRVLVVGGREVRRGGILSSAEIFDPETGQFSFTGSMASPRHKHAASLLPDGRVLVIGGADVRDQDGRYRSTEIYNPATGSFIAGPDMRGPRFKIPDAVVTLASGNILVAGGARQLEVYDVRTGTFTTFTDELQDGMEFATASLLPDGDILLLGGYDHAIRTSASAWLVRGVQ